MGNFFSKLKRSRIYGVAAGCIVLALISLLIDNVPPLMHLPDWAQTFLVLALLVGFAVSLFLTLRHRAPLRSGTPAPSPDTASAFEQALSLHRRGRLDDAESSYRAILAEAPRNSDALHMLGIISYQKGRHLAAVELIDRAIAINPNVVAAHFNRGGLLHGLRRLDEALVSYDRAVQLKPDYAEAFSNRGNLLFDLKRLDEACASYDRAVQLRPDYAEAFNNRGTVLRNLNRPAEALASYERAVQLKCDYAEAFYNRGNTLLDLKRPDEALASYDRAVQIKPDYAQAFYNRGNLLLELKRPEEALASYDRVVQLNPDDAEAFNNRGNALLDLKRPEEALASYDRALTIKPDYAEACNNGGKALFDLQRFDEACARFDRAVQLKPDYAEAFSNRGDVLRTLKRPHEALASYDRAVQLKPDYAEAFSNRGNLLRDPLKRQNEALESFGRALQLKPDFVAPRYNSGLVKLLAGRYREGWADYEWRWKDETHPEERPTINAPAWQGEALRGCRVAVYCEQGLGDIIQFARYLPLLVQRGAKITFLVPPKLTRLLRTLACEIEFVSSIDNREPFDFQCALMSLPLWFGTELSSIPNNFPYLHAETDLVSQWKEKIADREFKIGIAWQGSPSGDRGNKGRSIPLAEFSPLSQVPGIRLISLQKGYGVEQLATLPAAMQVETLGSEFDSGPDAFIDTAALMSTLDLVLTSDTSIAHLAGALGCPTWLALKYVPDWRWLLDREDSPWYPTMRLFRQQTDGDWKFVFTKIARELGSYPLMPALTAGES